MTRSTEEFSDRAGGPVGIAEAPPERRRGARKPLARTARPAGRMFIPPSVTLAGWRLRKTWGLLLVTGIGIVAAVMLVCAVPLFTDIAMTAGLRDALNSSGGSNIFVYGTSTRISAQVINQTSRALNQDFQKNLGPYLGSPYFSLQLPPFPILSSGPGGSLRPTVDKIGLISAPMDASASHVHLLKGRLPQINSSDIEIAITPESAARLQMTVGSTIPVSLAFIDANQTITQRTIPLSIVGLFHVDGADDPFWNGDDFGYSSPEGNQEGFTFQGLASTETLLSAFTKISDSAAAKGQFLENSATLFWSYYLDVQQLKISDLDAVVAGVQNVQLDTSNDQALENSPFIENSKTYLPTNILQNYHDRVPVAQFPVASLLLLILGLVLFFVSLMVDLLVEHQSGAIAILRSRGASRRQVFSALMIQGIGLAIIALVAGPLLGIVIARFLAQQMLPAADLGALNIIAGNPLEVAFGLRWYVLAASGVAVLTMFIALLRAMRADILAMRREAARASQRPLWQRLNLDVVAAIIMVAGFGFSLYLNNSTALDARLHILLFSPLTFLETVFLLLAVLLLLLRFYPLILRGGSWLAARSRSAAPALALAQMARAPQQSMRMILLLALASSFAIFTQVFTASQAQRVIDTSTYQVGADFSGTIPHTIILPQQLGVKTAAYRAIPGVTSASLGYTTLAKAGGIALQIHLSVRAVDADTYASTAIWPAQDAPQRLPALMAGLSAQRASSIAHKLVPAIVDASTMNALHLSIGANFTADFSTVDYTTDLVRFVVVAQVQDIPAGDGGTGMLVDYLTFALVYANNHANPQDFYVPVNYAWLRTKSDAASLASVRNALINVDLGLYPLYDRRALMSGLLSEPLYLTLNGVLALGAATTLLLALIGCLIASWLSTRRRLTNFAVLRALGASPPHLGSILGWEQGIIYITALVMGIIFGALLAVLALPALIYTSVAPNNGTNNSSPVATFTGPASSSVTSNQVFYMAQSAPSIQIVIPPSLWIIFGALVVICIVTLGMMLRVASKPSMSQTLRLNED